MKRPLILMLIPAAMAALAAPAFAHHLMGGKMPSTFGEGILSGLAPSPAATPSGYA